MNVLPSTHTVTLEHEIDVYSMLDKLSEADRVAWVKVICETCKVAGTIHKLRAAVNAQAFD